MNNARVFRGRAFVRPYRLGTPLAVALIALAMIAALLQLSVVSANAAGPAYDGPQTQATGPAFFGPAPNVFPYCENPTYFDPFPENVNPIGRIDPTGSPNASVTTDGITMEFELTAEGSPGTQYPGFFPEGADGGAGDQPKGIEMASGDAATMTLSEPLFYTQWIFTDVDRANEGFFVTPAWVSAPGQVAVFGGDANFDFSGTTTTEAAFNDTDTVSHDSEAIEGRVQVDLLGAVTGVSVVRDTGNGQSGFAVGGGCESIGVSKEVSAGPTWNGTSFDVSYTIRVRNNLPSPATIGADIDAALAAAASGITTGAPVGIDLVGLTLEDVLTDAAFSSISVVSNVNTSGAIETNPAYDGQNDTNLLAADEVIGPESEEEFVLTLQYVPDAAGPVGPNCATPYELLNQARVAGIADGVDVEDLSDSGADPDPGVNNAAGGNDDPTVVTFECPPVAAVSLDIVKTVVPGPDGLCPAFDQGVKDEGPALDVIFDSTVTYCITVKNTGAVAIDNVLITDPQAPATFVGAVGTLAPDAEATASFDLAVTASTPLVNTAGVTGDDPAGGSLPEVTDPAVINPMAPPFGTAPAITLDKTVVKAGTSCDDAVEGVDEFVLGVVGDAITWCFVVTNTGDTDLTNVIFNDGPAGITDRDLLDGRTPPVLAIDETISFSLDGTIPAGGVDNVADVVAEASEPDGTPLVNLPPVTDENEAAINETALTIDKEVVAGANGDCTTGAELVTVPLGETVTYCFTVTNTGGVSVLVTEVNDITLGVVVPIAAADQILRPGESVTVSMSAPSTGDLVNIAEVEGIPVDEDGVPFPDAPPLNPDDPAEVDTLSADLSIIKTIGRPGPLPVQSVIDYTLAISNDGPDPAVNVVVTDTLPAGLTFETLPDDSDWICARDSETMMTCEKQTPMPPDTSTSLSYWVRIEAEAPSNTPLINTATVGSDTPDPDPDDNDDTEETERVDPPSRPLTPEGPPTITNPPPGPPGPPSPVPAPPVVPSTPAVPLAVTGAQSGLLVMLAVFMTMLGGVLWVGGRRTSQR